MSTSSPTQHNPFSETVNHPSRVSTQKEAFKKRIMARMMNDKTAYEQSADKFFEACIRLGQDKTDETVAAVQDYVEELAVGFCGGIPKGANDSGKRGFAPYSAAKGFLFYMVHIHFPKASENLIAHWKTKPGTHLLYMPKHSVDERVKAQNGFYHAMMEGFYEAFGSVYALNQTQEKLKSVLDPNKMDAIYRACLQDIDALSWIHLNKKAQNARFTKLGQRMLLSRKPSDEELRPILRMAGMPDVLFSGFMKQFDRSDDYTHEWFQVFRSNRNTWHNPKGMKAAVALLVMAHGRDNDRDNDELKCILLELISAYFFNNKSGLRGMLRLLFANDELNNDSKKLVVQLMREIGQAKNTAVKRQLLNTIMEIRRNDGAGALAHDRQMLALLYALIPAQDNDSIRKDLVAILCDSDLESLTYPEKMIALLCKLAKNQCIDSAWEMLISRAQKIAAKAYHTAYDLKTALKIKEDGFFEVFHETMAEPHVLDHTKKESRIASLTEHKAAIATVIQAELNGFHVLSKALGPNIKLELKRKDIWMLLILLRKCIQMDKDKDNDHQMSRTGYARDNSEVKLLKELNLGKTRAHPISVTDVWAWFKEDYKASNKQTVPYGTNADKLQKKEVVKRLNEDDDAHTPQPNHKRI